MESHGHPQAKTPLCVAKNKLSLFPGGNLRIARSRRKHTNLLQENNDLTLTVWKIKNAAKLKIG